MALPFLADASDFDFALVLFTTRDSREPRVATLDFDLLPRIVFAFDEDSRDSF